MSCLSWYKELDCLLSASEYLVGSDECACMDVAQVRACLRNQALLETGLLPCKKLVEYLEGAFLNHWRAVTV